MALEIEKIDDKYFLNEENISIELSKEELIFLDREIDKMLLPKVLSDKELAFRLESINITIPKLRKIKYLENDTIKEMLKEVDRVDLTIILTLLNDQELNKKIYDNCSYRAAKLFEEEIENVDKIKLADAWKAVNSFKTDQKGLYDNF